MWDLLKIVGIVQQVIEFINKVYDEQIKKRYMDLGRQADNTADQVSIAKKNSSADKINREVDGMTDAEVDTELGLTPPPNGV